MIEPQAFPNFSEQTILVAGVAGDCQKSVRSQDLHLFESFTLFGDSPAASSNFGFRRGHAPLSLRLKRLIRDAGRKVVKA